MGKNKIVYRGPIKLLSAGSVVVKDNAVILRTVSTVINRDAEFYRNWCGRAVSFDYSTVLPTHEEAFDYVQRVVSHNPNSGAGSCLYVDSNDLVAETITKDEFKQLKKRYKTNNKC